MLCSKCALPILAFYLLLEEISAIALPSRLRNKRDSHWPDLDLIRLTDHFEQGDLSAGDAGVTGRAAQSETLASPSENLPVPRQHQHQHQHQRKNNEKRRKITPMDTIGSFQMSSLRNRKNEPESYFHWDNSPE